MSDRSISSRAFEALGRVTWKVARRKAKDTIDEHRPGAGKTTTDAEHTERRRRS